MSSGWRGGVHAGAVQQVPERLTCDVALETSDDIRFGLPFCEAAFRIGERGRVPAHPDDHDPVERGVRVSMPAPVEPVSRGLSRRGGERRHTTERGKGGFRMDPARIVPGHDEQLGRRIGSDPEGGPELRSLLLGEAVELTVMEVHLTMEVQPSVREGPQRVFGGRLRSRDRTWPKPGTSMQERRVGESRELFPEVRRGRHEEGLEGDQRLTPGADGPCRARP